MLSAIVAIFKYMWSLALTFIIYFLWTVADAELKAFTSHSAKVTVDAHDLFHADWTTHDVDSHTWAKDHSSKSVEVRFNFSLEKLSELYLVHNILLNIIIVGACDGRSDKSIEMFVKNSHWKGLFVEPVQQNVRDLRRMFSNRSHSQTPGTLGVRTNARSIVLKAAALDRYGCGGKGAVINGSDPSSSGGGDTGADDRVPRMVTITRPPDTWLVDPSLPHWKSREISRVFNTTPGSLDKTHVGWITESVPCVTGVDLMRYWRKRYYHCGIGHTQQSDCLYMKSRMYRDSIPVSSPAVPDGVASAAEVILDVLKIDTEGSDAQVLRGFELDRLDYRHRPLLVFFEVKMLSPSVTQNLIGWLRDL